MAKFCTNCGTKLADDAVFCTECGTRQGIAAPMEVETAERSATQQNLQRDVDVAHMGNQDCSLPAVKTEEMKRTHEVAPNGEKATESTDSNTIHIPLQSNVNSSVMQAGSDSRLLETVGALLHLSDERIDTMQAKQLLLLALKQGNDSELVAKLLLVAQMTEELTAMKEKTLSRMNGQDRWRGGMTPFLGSVAHVPVASSEGKTEEKKGSGIMAGVTAAGLALAGTKILGGIAKNMATQQMKKRLKEEGAREALAKQRVAAGAVAGGAAGTAAGASATAAPVGENGNAADGMGEGAENDTAMDAPAGEENEQRSTIGSTGEEGNDFSGEEGAAAGKRMGEGTDAPVDDNVEANDADAAGAADDDAGDDTDEVEDLPDGNPSEEEDEPGWDWSDDDDDDDDDSEDSDNIFDVFFSNKDE